MKLITILGPTAVGKTRLAVQLAKEINGELISADSRQVYRGMDLGTGKDLEEFTNEGMNIPYHLIDIRDAGEAYDVFQFQQDFYRAYKDIVERSKVPILCGGTGMYLQAALAKKSLVAVPVNEVLRGKLKELSQENLIKCLKELEPELHNTTDLLDRERTIRAIEIAQFKAMNSIAEEDSPVKEHIVFGIKMQRDQLRERIEQRLTQRFSAGMIAEVENLLEQGVTHEMLHYYGLEYRFISQHLMGQMDYNDMFAGLLQAIRRFAKKQMTWYRRMEKQGIRIHWMETEWTIEEKMTFIKSRLGEKL
jgi:tRNA dimethylallyltransferase